MKALVGARLIDGTGSASLDDAVLVMKEGETFVDRWREG